MVYFLFYEVGYQDNLSAPGPAPLSNFRTHCGPQVQKFAHPDVDLGSHHKAFIYVSIHASSITFAFMGSFLKVRRVPHGQVPKPSQHNRSQLRTV